MDVAGELDVHRQCGVFFNLAGAVVEQDYRQRGVLAAQQFGGARALGIDVVGAAGEQDAVQIDDFVVQLADAGFAQGAADFVGVAVHVVVAEGGVHAQRRAHGGQMRAHVFGVVNAGVVVHDVAGQQHDVGALVADDRRQFVELARAHQHSQMQIGGHGDAQRPRHRFIDGNAQAAHLRRVGVVNRIGAQREKKQRRKQPQRPPQPLRGQQAAQGEIEQEGGKRGIHHKQHHHHPHRHPAEKAAAQFEQQAGNQAVGYRKGGEHQRAPAAAADMVGKQPLQRAAESESKKLHQQHHQDKQGDTHRVFLIGRQAA